MKAAAASPPILEWLADGSPYSPLFSDVYRSRGVDGYGALAQSEQIFLHGCGLPKTWRGKSRFHILETGFGLGLNFLSTWLAWSKDCGACKHLTYTGIEGYPVSAEDILRSVQVFDNPALQDLASQLASVWSALQAGVNTFSFADGKLSLQLLIGDAAAVMPSVASPVDAVYLDGFSPARNPAMWRVELLQNIAQICTPATRLASYTVAKPVLKALQQAGFVCEAIPDLQPKRQRLSARVFDPNAAKHVKPRKIHWTASVGSCTIIGAGLAGAACARAMAEAGWQVTVLDRAAEPASGASGLPVGLFCPVLQSPALAENDHNYQLQLLGIHRATAQFERYLERGLDWDASGVVEIKNGHKHHHTQAGWVKPKALVRAWLNHPRIHFQGHSQVDHLDRIKSDCMVLANAHEASLLSPVTLPLLRPIRGQIAWGRLAELATETLGLNALQAPRLHASTPMKGACHLIPQVADSAGDFWSIGASFERDQNQSLIRKEDHAVYLDKLQSISPEDYATLKPLFDRNAIHAWAGIRCYTPDRMPLVGHLHQRVFICTAFGSRGLNLSALCAEMLLAQIQGSDYAKDFIALADYLDTARYLGD